MGDAFFQALAHVRQIHGNCKTLLRTHHQRAGEKRAGSGLAATSASLSPSAPLLVLTGRTTVPACRAGAHGHHGQLAGSCLRAAVQVSPWSVLVSIDLAMLDLAMLGVGGAGPAHRAVMLALSYRLPYPYRLPLSRPPACRWVQQECRELSEADAPEVNPLLQQAAAALRERPVRSCTAAAAGPCLSSPPSSPRVPPGGPLPAAVGHRCHLKRCAAVPYRRYCSSTVRRRWRRRGTPRFSSASSRRAGLVLWSAGLA